MEAKSPGIFRELFRLTFIIGPQVDVMLIFCDFVIIEIEAALACAAPRMSAVFRKGNRRSLLS